MKRFANSSSRAHNPIDMGTGGSLKISIAISCALALMVSLATSGIMNPNADLFRTLKSPGEALKNMIAGSTSQDHRAKVQEAYGKLPLSFEINRGQTDSSVGFVAHGSDSTAFLRPNSTVFRTAGHALFMNFEGSNPNAALRGMSELGGRSNYYVGNDPSNHQLDVAHFAKVRTADLYPGIDAVWYSKGSQLEYDLVVSPGADPSAVALSFEGADRMRVDKKGNLVIALSKGNLIQKRPFIYQNVDGIRRPITGAYRLSGSKVSFDIGTYDRSRALVIDPLVYSTYLGGTNGIDTPFGIAVDSLGSAVIVGQTGSTTFPTTPGPIQGDQTGNDGFVTKLSPDGATLVYSTYLGGNNANDLLRSVAVDSANNAYVGGTTASTNFPTTTGVFQTAKAGAGTTADLTVSKISPTGARVYATYLGGSGADFGPGVAVDEGGNVYVSGASTSTDFPLQGAIMGDQPGQDVVVTKLNSTATGPLLYSTYLGGASSETPGDGAIGVDSAGNAYIGGSTASGGLATAGAFQTTIKGGFDLFAARINSAGSALDYFTYLGGSGSDTAADLAVSTGGNAYISGQTAPAGTDTAPTPGTYDYPTTPGSFQPLDGAISDAVVTKLNTTGTALVYSTYLGGSGSESNARVTIDSTGAAYLTGSTGSSDFPEASATQGALAANSADAFVTKLGPLGDSVVYSTYLGGSQTDIGRDISVREGKVFVTGTVGGATSANFPTTAGAFQTTDPNPSTTQTSGFVSQIWGSSSNRFADFRGKGATDIAVYRPSEGVWYLRDGAVAVPWGGSEDDVPVSADYNGDGKTDVAVYRADQGTWYINTREGLPTDVSTIAWGGDPSDVPVPDDYDGDGDIDLAVYRAATGTWYINRLEGLPSDISQDQWGGDSTDKAVPGDYDKDGDTDLAVYRAGTGQWYVKNQPALEATWGGDSSDKAVPSDYDGDGDIDFAVYRTATGYWYVKDQPALEGRWGGASTDKPVPGDYNRDGKTEFAVYRNEPNCGYECGPIYGGGIWFLMDREPVQWGAADGDIPLSLPAAFR